MQMHSVETSSGAPICCEPSRMASLQPAAFLEVPLDVLDGDRRIIDQDADGERQPAQRHDVDRLPDRAEGEDRAQDRERDRDGDDQRAAPAAEEDQDHHGRSGRVAMIDLADHAVDGGLARRRTDRASAFDV